MTVHDDLMTEMALPAMFEHQGTAGVTYTPEGGSGVSLTAVLWPEELVEEQYADGTRLLRRRDALISRDPAGEYGGVASPEVHDTLTIGGELWNVQEFAKQTSEFTILRLTSGPIAERAHPAFRR